jgi:hypothetical protein
VVEQTFKNSQHQVHIQNQLVQLLLWLKHGVVVVAAVAVQNIQVGIIPQVVAVAVVELMRIVYLKPLTLGQQKPLLLVLAVLVVLE